MKSKITIVLPNLRGGGAERLHVNLANDWVTQGFNIEFVLLRKEGKLIQLLDTTISVVGLNVDRIRDAVIPLAAHLRKSPPQVVLAAMWPLTSAAVLAWLFSGCKGKLFLSDHEHLTSSYILRGRAKPSYLKNLIRFSYPLASGVVAVSRGVKEDLFELGRLQEHLVRVIYNPAAIGIPSDQQVPLAQAQLWGTGVGFHILTVGRLAPQKDHKTLIYAFALLPADLNAKLVILGEGPLRVELEALVAQLKLEGRVLMPGFMMDPYPWLHSADLFVLSSLWEGFGNVIVEAFECGLPVVSTNCLSGPAEILNDGQFGKLVPVNDPAALSAAMVESLNISHDRAALKRRALDFSVRKISDEYLAYFFRECPICKSKTAKPRRAFPYSTKFNNISFSYLKCKRCKSVFVDPTPDDDTFVKMYAKADYHDCFYELADGDEYLASAQMLKQYLPLGAHVLDYGCGVGSFLQALSSAGFLPFGVDFNKDAANLAAQRACCEAISVDDFVELSVKPKFDAIHFGDVLEHLPDPAKTLKELLKYLKPGGILYVEGPIEINPSPVYWASRLFGEIKRLVRPTYVANYPPTHLFRTGASQQLAFFKMIDPNLKLRHWHTYETGWPYAQGGIIKRAIAAIAIFIGSKKLGNLTFGNRFLCVFECSEKSNSRARPISVS
jgi:glycosyltransferase involved in cell wall biosynthesis/2-polyprenyl-3-methyl-5-hydroxy-6-metoxy-1,4-benzoquinol methylase